MKLSKFLLRYFPPGIALEYLNEGVLENKMIDLFHLTPSSKLEEIASDLIKKEPLLTEKVKPQLVSSLYKLQKNLIEDSLHTFGLLTVLKHDLPVTNIAFSKSGDKCLTGSFDRTCKVWDIDQGKLFLTLEGHNNIVYDVAFNYPYSDRVLTASFDRTASVWDSETGEHLVTMWGHTNEVLVIKYDNSKQHIATGSMDKTARVFDINTGLELCLLEGHDNAIVKLEYSNDGRLILTGSFDSQVFLWDARSNSIVYKFKGHRKPITCCKFNFDCSSVATSSLDGTVKIFDVRTLKNRSKIYHGDDVLDISFDSTGQRLLSCGSQGICKVWDVNHNISPISTMIGHEGEISKVSFSPGGGLVLTGSSDCTARIWNSETGDCCQVLDGHTDEIYSCGFTYDGRTIVTASKDNTCHLWKKAQHPDGRKYSQLDSSKNISSTLSFEKLAESLSV